MSITDNSVTYLTPFLYLNITMLNAAHFSQQIDKKWRVSPLHHGFSYPKVYAIPIRNYFTDRYSTRDRIK
jgi:hypothetical protein